MTLVVLTALSYYPAGYSCLLYYKELVMKHIASFLLGLYDTIVEVQEARASRIVQMYSKY